MAITIGNGPLSPTPPSSVNYTIEGPKNKILFSPFPRRVRAMLGDHVVLDSDEAMFLYESGLLPALYVPTADIDEALLTRTDHSTHCPYKGDASYWSVTAGDVTSQNAVWGYESPLDSVSWLSRYRAFYWDRMDRWFDEDEEVAGHLRDPFHRIDIRPTSRRVKVEIGDVVVADSARCWVLSETGLANRYYLPEADIRTELFETSQTVTHCPYKGDATYRSRIGSDGDADVAWVYEDPFDDARRIAGCWSFAGESVKVTGSS